MDDYSKTGPKTPGSAAQQREREAKSQMRTLLAIKDEQTLVKALSKDYELMPTDPKFKAILKIWRDAQQQLQRGY